METEIKWLLSRRTVHWLFVFLATVTTASAWSYNISISVDLPGCLFINGQYSCYQAIPEPRLTNATAGQNGYQFEVRTGDINYDGRQDIYLARTSGSSANGVISKTILYQQSNGQFAPLPATGYQLQLAAGWPRSSIKTVVADFNADGFVDVMLKRVAATIHGKLNQVVFSNKQANGRAAVVMPVTADFKKTFQSLAAQRTNPSYFNNNLISVSFVVWRPSYQCAGSWSWYERYCYADWRPYLVRAIGYNSGVISSSAVAAKNIIDSIQSGSRAAGEGGSAIGKILAKVLGAVVGGLCQTDEDTREEYPNIEDCMGYELFTVVATNANATDEIELDRPKNVVNITYHGLIWRALGPDHLAIEFFNSEVDWGITKLRTLSAGSQNGLLTKDYNRGSDDPLKNLLAAPVNRGETPAEDYFDELIALQDNYKNNLNYDLVPGLYSDGYNSNSYVAGLVYASGGFTLLDFNLYVGGAKPVPASEFR